MQIVIDIPESIKEHIEDGSYGKRPYDRYLLITAVLKGTPLPKGHGRLIDESEMLKRLNDWNWEDVIEKNLCNFALNRIIESPTIIEADEPESEDESRTPGVG